MCELDTFVGREPVDDEHGEPTGAYEVLAQCNGNYVLDCGWKHVLWGSTEAVFSVNDWWITNTTMQKMHAAHQAGETL